MTCVTDRCGRDAVECCVLFGINANHGVLRDWCGDCIEAGKDDCNFGRCYECADGLHDRCIGVPCQCECPETLAKVMERAMRDTTL